MAGSVNKVILVGNLGADPEIRRLNSGDPVVNIRIATSESWRDKNSGERKEKTEWHNVVIFNDNLAKVAEQYLKKGMKVYVEGQLQTRKWQDQTGPGPIHDRGRAAEIPRRAADARCARAGRRRPGRLFGGGRGSDFGQSGPGDDQGDAQSRRWRRSGGGGAAAFRATWTTRSRSEGTSLGAEAAAAVP